MHSRNVAMMLHFSYYPRFKPSVSAHKRQLHWYSRYVIEHAVGRGPTSHKRTSVHLLVHKLLNHKSTAVWSQEGKSKHPLCSRASSVPIACSACNGNNNRYILGILSLRRRVYIKHVYFLLFLLYIRTEYLTLTDWILTKFGVQHIYNIRK
jgi:hypothetical protein